MIRKILHNIKKQWQNKGLILMYHRIDETTCDPWELVVHPENFEEQLQFLKQNKHVVSMEKLATSIINKTLKKNTVAITFDDGYLDNFTNAAPLLEKHQLPATFFITTSGIGTDNQFWWDELQDLILLNQTLPKEFNLTINHEKLFFDLGDEQTLNKNLIDQTKTWCAEKPFVNKRTELYFSLWKLLRTCEPAIRKKYLQDIRQWAGMQSIQSGKMMNWEQVNTLRHNKLFSIGAHTVNHPALGAQPLNIQTEEIINGKTTLNKMLNKDISGFAYPHGNYNQDTISILEHAGFQYAVTTESKIATNNSPRFELPRFQIKNWNRSVFSHNFKQWLSDKV